MNRQQLADAYERAQREINAQQERNEERGPTAGISAAREYDRSGLQGTSLDRVEPVKEPFNEAALGQQQANDQPNPPSLEYRPPAPAPSPKGMGGPAVVEPAGRTQEAREFQEEARDTVDGIDHATGSGETARQYPATSEELGDHVVAFLGEEGPQTKEAVDARAQQVREMQERHEAKQEAQAQVREWAESIKAREKGSDGPEQARELE